MAYRNTEQRWFRVAVRPIGAIGKFQTQDFYLTVEVTGSYHALISEAMELINAGGYEVHHIVGHSSNQETL